MQKIIKVDNKVTVVLNNGNIVEREIIDKDFQRIVDAQSDEEVLNILYPKYQDTINSRKRTLSLIERIQKSSILNIRDNTIYWEDVSCLSIPQELAEAIVNAEEEHSELKISTYRNFWILMSLNPDEECRKNLFWFLQKYGMTISRYGFFIGYRNVDTTDKKDVFTDHHTHTFKIRIGEMVTMDRNKCDCDSSKSCSTGLHCSGKGWLKANYFGNTGLACLINPADVVAVP